MPYVVLLVMQIEDGLGRNEVVLVLVAHTLLDRIDPSDMRPSSRMNEPVAPSWDRRGRVLDIDHAPIGVESDRRQDLRNTGLADKDADAVVWVACVIVAGAATDLTRVETQIENWSR